MPFPSLRPRTTRSATVLEERSNGAFSNTKIKNSTLARASRSTMVPTPFARSRRIMSSGKPYSLPNPKDQPIVINVATDRVSAPGEGLISPQQSVADRSVSSDGEPTCGISFDGEGPQFLKRVIVADVFNSLKQPTTVDFEASVAKGFFQVRNNWTCYRRNYIAVAARLRATPVELYLADGRRIDRLSFSIAAITCDRTPQQTQIVQHTAKRDKGPQLQPAHQTVSAPSYTATWERLQFRFATLNNGKKKTHQQYFSVKLTLSGIIFNGNGAPDSVALAHSFSEPLIVRGRSPGHYNDCAADDNAREDGTPAPNLDRVCYWLDGTQAATTEPLTPSTMHAPLLATFPGGVFESQPYVLAHQIAPQASAQHVVAKQAPRLASIGLESPEDVLHSAQSKLGTDYFSAGGATHSGGIPTVSPLPVYKVEQTPVESLRQMQQHSPIAVKSVPLASDHSAIDGQRLPTYAELSAHLNKNDPAVTAKAVPAFGRGLKAIGELSRQEAAEALFALQSGA